MSKLPRPVKKIKVPVRKKVYQSFLDQIAHMKPEDRPELISVEPELISKEKVNKQVDEALK